MFKWKYLTNVVEERGLQADATAGIRTPILAFASIFASIRALSRIHWNTKFDRNTSIARQEAERCPAH